MTRKDKFEAVWKKYEKEAEEAKFHAKKAKEDNRKSDYEFWCVLYDEAAKQSKYFFNRYLNA